MESQINTTPDRCEEIEAVDGSAGRYKTPVLSLAQQELWQSYRENTCAIEHVMVRFRLQGKLNRRALLLALDRIVARHEVLRTAVRNADGEPSLVTEPVDIGFALVEQSATGSSDIEACCLRELTEPFPLSGGPLVRGRLLRISKHEHALLITHHPLVSDRISMRVFMRELGVLYRAFALGKDDPLESQDSQYVDYVRRQRSEVSKHSLHTQIDYWQRQLSDIPVRMLLPADRARMALSDYSLDFLRIELPGELTKQLQKSSAANGVTLFSTFLCAWADLLGRWCRQEEVLIGTRMAGRCAADQLVMGQFECVAPLRIKLDPAQSVENFVRNTACVVEQAAAHQNALAGSFRCSSLQVMFEFDDELTSRDVQWAELTLIEVPVVKAKTKFELSLSLRATGEGFIGALKYASELFERDSIERLLANWQEWIGRIARDMRQPVSGLLTASERDRARITCSFNATQGALSQEKTIHQLFEEQAARTPESVAVTHEGNSLTYAQLNARANQFAWYLRAKGAGPDALVGVCVDRGLNMAVGLLGILKAGSAYVPLDPNLPGDRLHYMLEDSAPQVVLTQEKLRTVLPSTRADVVSLDAISSETTRYPTENLSGSDIGLTSLNSAYVIYTSGSTGRPKGTAMSHRAMVNLIEWHRKVLPASDETRVLQFAALSFDVAFQETFSTLCTGGTLVFLDEWIRRDSRVLTDFLNTQRIERLFVPPMLLQSLAESFKTTGLMPASLRDVITAGEQLRVTAEVASFFKASSGCRLHNHYGPTETHVVTALTLVGDPEHWPVLPSIGQPVANTQIYVLNEYLQPVPIGFPGEIYIGGAGVAQGYRQRPELTAQRFLSDPFDADTLARMYRTGDVGRWRADGTVEYLGRNDDQVKIRGFRIELGEIETQLSRHWQVQDAVVVVREDVPGERRLVAYITPRDGSEIKAEDLRAHLKELLPDYMVPGAFVALNCWPLSPNGKLDRRALPAPARDSFSSRHYESPQGETEQTVAKIWQDLLRTDRVGRQDNFFELGGDSLLIVQLMERLRRDGLSVDVRSVYASATLADLAHTLAEVTTLPFQAPLNGIPMGCEAITPQMLPLVQLDAQQIERIVQSVPGGAAAVQDIYPLAPLQEGILFHHLLDEQSGDTYVLPILLALSTREKLEELIAALQEVIDRHDVLRTAVLWEHLPRPLQVVYREANLPVDVIALDRGRDPVDQLKERMSPDRLRLNLNRAPLMQLDIAADPQGGKWYALLQLHHLLCDHESLETLLAEVMAHVEGRGAALPQPVGYRTHVAQALSHAHSSDAQAFFRGKLGDVVEPTAPFGLLDVRGDGCRIEEFRETLDPALASRIRVEARRLNVSAATLFHAAWALVVAQTTGRDDVVFGSLLSGRLQGSAGAQHVLGMFINTLPLRLQLSDVTPQELVRQTQRELVELLNHEQASLAEAQRCSGVAASAPLFSSLLNFLHSTPLSEAPGIQVLEIREWTNYPITVAVDDRGDAFVVTAATDSRIKPDRITGYLQTAIHSLVEGLEKGAVTSVLQLSILPPMERHQVVSAFNRTEAIYPRERLIHELFEEQAARTPDSTALIYEGQSLTFATLNSRANQLARHLAAMGIGPDRLAGLCVDRSVEMIVGVLGILKCGGAYVPLDPAYPTERLNYLLTDAAPQVLLTQESLRATLPETTVSIVALDTDWSRIAEQETSDLDPRSLGISSEHLAYVIYTSGSTGQPKGVLVEHRHALCLWQGLERATCSSDSGPIVALNASLNFDASVQQYMQLLAGRTVVIVPQTTRRDASLLLRFIEKHQVAAIDCTPSQLKSWMSAGLLEKDGSSLRTVLVGGEPIDPELWNQLAQTAGVDFYNVYGPTECTVDTTLARLRLDNDAPHIGRPMENRRVYILDQCRQPVPVGVVGELYIGGEGISRGYLRRPGLTAQRFMPAPFTSDPHARVYRTGDLGRWRVDGTIEYVGRNDDQVKIRGHRIELGEIEAQLLRHSSVKETVVLAREDVPGEKRLVAYMTANDARLTVENLRTPLSALVPEYMVPAAFVILQKFPLTPNGKLDRRALPAPELNAYSSRAYESPHGEVEKAVAEIWQTLLRVERVGRHDNFFELGGHSILAMQVKIRVRSTLSLEMPMSLLFESPTLKALSAKLGALRRERLCNNIAKGGDEMGELLASVSSLPESKVREMVRKLRMEGRL